MNMWDVRVPRGAKEVPADEPTVTFGTPTVSIGKDGELSPTFVPLVYSGVNVRSQGKWACIEVTDFSEPGRVKTRMVREMDLVSQIEFEPMGQIRIEGAEAAPDGALHLALWIVEPASFDDEAED